MSSYLTLSTLNCHIFHCFFVFSKMKKTTCLPMLWELKELKCKKTPEYPKNVSNNKYVCVWLTRPYPDWGQHCFAPSWISVLHINHVIIITIYCISSLPHLFSTNVFYHNKHIFLFCTFLVKQTIFMCCTNDLIIIKHIQVLHQRINNNNNKNSITKFES